MAPTSTDYVFCFNDKLPLKYEIVFGVIDKSKNGPPSGPQETKLRKEVMICMTNSLLGIWKKAFGDGDLFLTYAMVRRELVSLLTDFHNSVTLPGIYIKKWEKKIMLS